MCVCQCVHMYVCVYVWSLQKMKKKGIYTHLELHTNVRKNVPSIGGSENRTRVLWLLHLRIFTAHLLRSTVDISMNKKMNFLPTVTLPSHVKDGLLLWLLCSKANLCMLSDSRKLLDCRVLSEQNFSFCTSCLHLLCSFNHYSLLINRTIYFLPFSLSSWNPLFVFGATNIFTPVIIVIITIIIILLYFGGTGVWIQGPSLARKVLCQSSYASKSLQF
jgi:hypothetical protein